MSSYTPWQWSEPYQRYYCYLLADDRTTILDTLWGEGSGRGSSDTLNPHPAIADGATDRILHPLIVTPAHISNAQGFHPNPQGTLHRRATDGIINTVPSTPTHTSNVQGVNPNHQGALTRRATDGVYAGFYTSSSTNPNTTFQPGQHVEITDRNTLPFKCVDSLGSGASAVVDIVADHSGQQFARKIFRVYHGSNLAKMKAGFMNEIGIMKRLQIYPHIIKVFGSYTCGRELGMLLLPVANEGDLRAYLGRIKDAGAPTPPQSAALFRALGCLARGLAFIHAHTIRHKDIKPSNILMHDNYVVYTDFGISVDASELDSTTTTGPSAAFTQRYCAPEVVDSQPRNSKSDVFSLGCVFMEMLIAMYPQADLGNSIQKPYWQKLDTVRRRLRDSKFELFLTCHAMLDPISANRIAAKDIIPRLSGSSCDKCDGFKND